MILYLGDTLYSIVLSIVLRLKVLREIGRKLGKKDWDFGKDPCSGEGKWRDLTGWKGSESSVTCDCSFNQNSSCHVISMYYPFLFLFFIYLFVFLLNRLC
ncbi:hypothetical protein UlMin_002195 [Ulmus minor]